MQKQIQSLPSNLALSISIFSLIVGNSTIMLLSCTSNTIPVSPFTNRSDKILIKILEFLFLSTNFSVPSDNSNDFCHHDLQKEIETVGLQLLKFCLNSPVCGPVCKMQLRAFLSGIEFMGQQTCKKTEVLVWHHATFLLLSIQRWPPLT